MNIDTSVCFTFDIRMYMCMYRLYMYAHVQITYIHFCICKYYTKYRQIYTYIYVCHVCMYVCIYIYMCVFTYTCIRRDTIGILYKAYWRTPTLSPPARKGLSEPPGLSRIHPNKHHKGFMMATLGVSPLESSLATLVRGLQVGICNATVVVVTFRESTVGAYRWPAPGGPPRCWCLRRPHPRTWTGRQQRPRRYLRQWPRRLRLRRWREPRIQPAVSGFPQRFELKCHMLCTACICNGTREAILLLQVPARGVHARGYERAAQACEGNFYCFRDQVHE